MVQLSYDPLDLTDQNPTMSLEEACRIMRKERDAQARRIRKEGRRCTGWLLSNQLRPYRGLGQPDGSVRPVYMLNVYDEPAGPVDISHETAYGRTVPASRAIRCY